MSRTVRDEIPLAGRISELERIKARLGPGDAPAFVLAGAPGVGKTRLAAEVGRAAAEHGFVVADVVASRSAASIPFGPFAPFLPASVPASDLLGLLRQAADAMLVAAGPEGRLLLVVDDAHLLDDGSAALVHQLVQTRGCGVVATVRTHEPAPDLVTALWKDGLAERIELDPLTEGEVAEVVAAFLGGPVAGASVRRLLELSQGNPLYLRELMMGGVASGALGESGGIWSLQVPLTAPARLVELVASRLEEVDGPTLDAIHLVAAGEPLPLSILEQLASPAAIEDAERLGFVHVHQDGRRSSVRLAHPLYGETVRQTLPAYRRRRISADLARALEASGARRRDDLLRLARWQLDAGVPESNPELLGRAARRAIEMFDYDLAAHLAERALESGGDIEAGIVLAETRFQSGRPADAEEVLAGLVALCTDDVERARIASARAYNLHVLLGDVEAAATVIDEALTVVTDPAARLRLQGRLATNRLMEGKPEEALAAIRPLLEAGDDSSHSRGAYVASIALALLGRGDEAVTVAHDGLAAHQRTGDINQLPVIQLVGSIMGRAATGHLAEAENEAAEGYEACLAAGDHEGQATFSLLRGCILIDRGHVAVACTSFLEGAAINRELQDTAALRWCLGGLALAAGMSGRTDQAREAAAELDGLRPGWMGLFEFDLVERGRAWAQVAAGETTHARKMLQASADRAAASGQWVAEARLLHDLARIGDPAAAAPRLAELATTVHGRFVRTYARHAVALQLEVPAEIEASGGVFEAFGACLLAAEADLEAARLLRAEGLAPHAAALTRRAEALLALCGEARTPALEHRGPATRLTRREREIAALAASGVSSPDIAAKLVLSVRTVENHLQNVFTKLMIGSRAELADALEASPRET
jgi:DNA-binding CsgD family transcriptional regulator